MAAIFFAKQADFRKWLQKNHKKETELLAGFYKVDTQKARRERISGKITSTRNDEIQCHKPLTKAFQWLQASKYF